MKEYYQQIKAISPVKTAKTTNNKDLDKFEAKLDAPEQTPLIKPVLMQSQSNSGFSAIQEVNENVVSSSDMSRANY